MFGDPSAAWMPPWASQTLTPYSSSAPGGLFGAMAPTANLPIGPSPQLPPMPGSDAFASAAPPSPGMIPPPMNMPQPGLQQPPQAPQGGSFSNSLYNMSPMLMAMGGAMMRGGLGAGLQAGAPAAAQMQQRNMQMAALQSTYEALIKSGVPPGVAQAAALNPEVLKTVAPNLYMKPQLQETRQNPLTGEKSFSVYDPNSQSMRPVAGGPQQPQAQDQGVNYDPVTRRDEAFLSTLDPITASAVKAAVNGNISGTGKTLNQIMPLAARYEDGFNQNIYNQRGQALHDFYGGGTGSNSVKSLNQFTGHLGQLVQAIQTQGNMGGIGTPLNAPWNATKSFFGATGQNPVATTAHAAADELSSLFKGKGISDSEIRQWEQSFRVNGSPEQQREDVGTLLNLAQHSLDALEKKRQDQLGPALSATMPPIVDQRTQATMDAIRSWAGGGQGPQQSPSPQGPVRVNDKASYDALPRGVTYIAPDGSTRTKQ